MQSPYDSLTATTWSTLEVSSARLAADVGISDVLAAAPDPEAGLPTAEIAAKAGVDPAKLGVYPPLSATYSEFC